MKFNEDEQNYDRFRPGYPDALMQDVIESFHAGGQSRILEIGIGTGQATQPILDTGCDLTAVELGENLARFVRDKFKQRSRFQVIQGDFMELELAENSWDGIYCATAFHWLPQRGIRESAALVETAGLPGLILESSLSKPAGRSVEPDQPRGLSTILSVGSGFEGI